MSGLYNYRWQQYRLQFLADHPLCKRCRRNKAEVVDHIVKHNGNLELFWEPTNHQGLCKHCHDSYKQMLEKSGKIAGADINGIPIDPNHLWNRSEK